MRREIALRQRCSAAKILEPEMVRTTTWNLAATPPVEPTPVLVPQIVEQGVPV
jgi:hypothetical protein